MAPAPAEYSPDFWRETTGDNIELTCLLPNGIMILLKCNYNVTLADVKEELWEEATKYPLHGKLHDVSVYNFMCINHLAEQEQLSDEKRTIKDIKPIGAVLIITETKKDTAEQRLNVQIGHLLGKRLQDFDALNSSEVNDFRFKMRKLGNDITQSYYQQSWQEQLHYQFPPRLSITSLIYTRTASNNKSINITARIALEYNDVPEKMQSSHTFNVSPDIRPKKLLDMILAKKAFILNDKNEDVDNYVLKVCGQDEYLVGDYPIIQYQYVQDSLSRDVTPVLVMVPINSVPVIVKSGNEIEAFDNEEIKKPKSSYSTLTLRKKGKYKSSGNIREKFRITLFVVSRLNCDPKKVSEVGILVGLFHGGKSLCQPQKTDDKFIPDNNDECTFDQTLIFDIDVCDIPRNAKLCFVVYESNKYSKGTRTKKTKENTKDNPVAWANTSVYDFKNQLKSGSMTLYFWSYADDMMCDDVFHPLGTVVSNPNTSYSTALTLCFDHYGDESSVYIYSPIESNSNYEKIEINTPTPQDIQMCKKILEENDNFLEIHEQDRKKIWYLREYWKRNAPEVLPKLLLCIDWDKREEVAEVTSLLQAWPRLPVEKTLELLDYAFADQEVRCFAVKCLTDITDDDILLYLLQLVQAIKHELYLESDLTRFLIERALNNQKIGHYLFWHLRSEMQVPAMQVRFALILEAYCRGRQEHIPILQKQVDALEQFKKCTELIRERRDKEKAKAALKEQFNGTDSLKIMKDLRNPLDPSFRCSKIKLEKCKIMDSKMRPLWLVFENCDPYGQDIYVIFKSGDDLRQDMLTLQMLRIMDRLWKSEGLDLRMNAYNCISMEHRVGMIEIVLNAETIANIQKKGIFSATTPFKKGPILDWLKHYNTTDTALNNAIKEFSSSCAGYCVATYVLGIADRHSDNIMITKNGQLFHIDFGHILGHFKEKFGFKRERVPFVLTHDFVNVINKGQKNGSEFQEFQNTCETAFMILRAHGSLILSLFAMMISTGLPELNSEKDLNYLRETLVLSKTDEDALQHFRSKFNEALTNSWKTSINFATHNIAAAKNAKT